jgi:hypothetical protein
MWRSFCETLSEQGRYGGLFILAILMFFAAVPVVVCLAVILEQLIRNGNQWLPEDANWFLMLIGLTAATWAFIEHRRRHRVSASKNYPISHPLAPLERLNARSKLLKSAK